MSDLQDFLMDNFEEAEPIERRVSLGGKEKIMKFKPISAATGDEIRRSCRKTTFHKGQRLVETDQDAFVAKLIIETTTVPDFKSQELQQSWGVLGAENLLKAMKTKMKDGEYATFSNIVSEVNGYDKSMNDLVEEAKN
ncbi:phage tail assembly chaperone [Desulfitobacterium hafniense]|uniref:Phage XkdN-like protein n=5 Tax=root TaxID=1 RepID=Q24QE8_DESHY|nr:hypothetical protein [Desulfitobacterium hafniense]ACL19471.1 XkdN-like protein [Desulfitobacterium hafniense DCB-2]EHL04014.1 phage XkdN-like protein [Desulfitobacterium hafniense DP7]KTE89287.1 hypothetical protein AT727_12865 [Desulfitobacterium hafniense]MEA5023575.1 hypothetical protein [Desulfitobacterium hafniense]BAE85744.1 hypothetical protein DSY3955 [Desulfitobacterium hafniense Y51]